MSTCSLGIPFAFVAVLPFSSSNVAAGTAVQRPSFRKGRSKKAEYHENQSDPEYHKRSSANTADSTLLRSHWCLHRESRWCAPPTKYRPYSPIQVIDQLALLNIAKSTMAVSMLSI